MQYLVWLIYVIIITEWIYQGKNAKRWIDTEGHGHKYYSKIGTVDMLLACAGFIVLSEFEKSIPKFLFIAGYVGCGIILGISIYSIYKMMITNK